MKKRWFLLLLCTVLLLSGTVRAVELPRIVDQADLLTAGEEARLEETAREFRERYDMDVVILTVWSLEGRSPREAADDYYDENGYGCGSDYSGMLFLLAMESRDWYISTSGQAIEVLTDYGIQGSADVALEYLSGGDYAEGFQAWLEVLPEYMGRWEEHTPTDKPGASGVDWVLSLIVGLLVGGVGVGILLATHRTNVPQAGAGSYLDSSSFRLYKQKDLFLHSHVTKTRRSENTTSGGSQGRSGGGSSVHRSSSGRRHGGGGGKF